MQRQWFVITILSLLYDTTFTTHTEIKNKDYKIKQLEKIKDELYVKINEAIDDSVKVLEKNNDTDSLLTVTNMKELKKQIDELNSTIGVDNITIPEDPFKGIVEIHDDTFSDIEIRKRKNISDVRRASAYGAIASSQNHKLQIDMKEILDLIKTKELFFTKEKGIKESKHDLEVKKKAEEWIEQTKREREKIKKYKDEIERYGTETCPNFGLKKRKKKKSTRRKRKSKKSKKSKKRDRKYPCCRKCCKKSYLGCL
ncbi:unnamed protein product [Diatraea saccharalis]|uniref:Uncharacterized protein n=1 Tax=Diatraea saccharalis TaxID=40085 RepID=A0A9N9WGQ4_9NEOP|nr:unnamed protein product [Diatraea saccharalis]